MARNGEGATSSTTTSRARPGADPLLIVCRCFRVITSLIALLCVAVNVLSAIRCFKDQTDIFDGIFRCYVVVVALFVVVAETEWHVILNSMKVLEYWVARGMLQIFVAVMTRAFSDTSGDRTEIVLLQNIASYMLGACGVVYIISGILCIGCLKRSRQRKEQAVRDSEDLKRRREDLEASLMQENAQRNSYQ